MTFEEKLDWIKELMEEQPYNEYDGAEIAAKFKELQDAA